MLNSGRIVGLMRTWSIRCYGCGRGEGCSVIYELVASFKSEKREVNVGDAWFRVSSLSLSLFLSFFLPLFLSLSLSLSLSWSSGPWTVVCLLLILARCREISLLYRFSLLTGSDWVFFVFYREGHGLAEKLPLLTNSLTFRYALIL